MKRVLMGRRLAAGAAIGALGVVTPAVAQTEPGETVLEDVVVLAQKRPEPLQRVPLSVSVVQGDRIEALGLQSFEQLSRYTPGLVVSEAATGNRITVRGVSSGTNRGFEQSVGLFVDGVYAGRARQFSTPFFDVQRVEVLKGPQGVVFGKNTVAGAVSLITTQPTPSPHVDLGGAYETRFGGSEATAIFNGPLTDTLSARLVLRWADTEGVLDNSLSGRQERSSKDGIARLTLLWKPSEAASVTGKYEYAELKARGSLFQLSAAGPFMSTFKRFDSAAEAELDLRQSLGSLTASTSDLIARNALVRADVALGANKLVALTGWSAFSSKVRNGDSDFTPAPLITFNDDETFEQISQELRLESPEDDALAYVIGAYAQHNTYRTKPENIVDGAPLGAPRTRNLRDFDQSSDTWSVFGEATWSVTERLKLVGGARYSVEDKDVHRRLTVLRFDGTGRETNPGVLAFNKAALALGDYDVRQSRTERQVSPSATLRYALDAHTMAYVRATRAYKGGGFDASDSSGGAAVYEDERATAAEAGLKTRLGPAELNLAVYTSTFRDLQVQAFDGVSFLTTNAGKARSRGVEVDGRWRPAPDWLLSGSLAYLSAKYLDYRGAACTTAQLAAHQAAGRPGGCTQDLSGRPLTDAPKWSASFNVNRHVDLSSGWSLDADVGANLRSAAYVAPDLDPLGRQGGYATWDASLRASAPGRRWSAALVARNLGDKRAMTYLVNAPLFSGAKSAAIIEPRTIELRLRAGF
ncbi:MAG: TonB-dependent receptor [Pseudomonadota bacterium]